MHLTRLIIRCIGGTAGTLNLLAIPFIYSKSSHHIGKYKYLMILYSISQATFSYAQAILVPIFIINSRMYIFFSTDDSLPRLVANIIMFGCWFAGFYQTMMLLTVQFVYRLFIMCRPHLLRWYHTPKRAAILVIFFFTLLIFYILVVAYGLLPTSATDNYVRDEVFNRTGLEISSLAYLGARMWENGHLRMDPVITLACCTLFMAAGVGVNFYCTAHILEYFYQQKQIVSRAVFRSHLRLFVLLALQTLFPIIFNLIPAAISYLLALLDIDIGENVDYIAAVFTVAQVIDPILTLTVIKDYRRALLSLICPCRNNRVTDLSNTASDTCVRQ